MATIDRLLDNLEASRSFRREVTRLFTTAFAMPRRRALRIARQLAAADDAGIAEFFDVVLGWDRAPTEDEIEAARVVLTRGIRWRKSSEIDPEMVAAYLSGAIVRRMRFRLRGPRRRSGTERGRFADPARLRDRLLLLHDVRLPEEQLEVLKRLRQGMAPADAVRTTGWRAYDNLMRRARHLERAFAKARQPPNADAMRPRLVRKTALPNEHAPGECR